MSISCAGTFVTEAFIVFTLRTISACSLWLYIGTFICPSFLDVVKKLVFMFLHSVSSLSNGSVGLVISVLNVASSSCIDNHALKALANPRLLNVAGPATIEKEVQGIFLKSCLSFCHIFISESQFRIVSSWSYRYPIPLMSYHFHASQICRCQPFRRK